MTEKNIKSRIQNKHDIEANWNKAVNFIPMQGEIIIYDIDSNYDFERAKIGDGVTSVVNLPFYLADEINAIKADLATKVSVSYDDTNALLLFTK